MVRAEYSLHWSDKDFDFQDTEKGWVTELLDSHCRIGGSSNLRSLLVRGRGPGPSMIDIYPTEGEIDSVVMNLDEEARSKTVKLNSPSILFRFRSMNYMIHRFPKN